jgi:hypothetical protein
VDQPQLDSMVLLVREAKTPEARDQAADALGSTCRNIKTHHGSVKLDPLAQELASGSKDVRIALFPVCSTLNDPQIRAALREGVEDPDPAVRAAAIRALCDSTDSEVLPDVLKLARETQEENYRTLAIRAAVRLTTQEDSAKFTDPQRLETMRTILALTLTDAQKRIVLSGLAQVPTRPSLKLIKPLLDEPAVQGEAAQAALKIGTALRFKEREASSAALKKVLATSTDDATKQAAQNALKQIQEVTDYIMSWEVAGPYLQTGKDYSDLFDMVFPPETAEAKGVKWKPIAGGTDENNPWIMDLLTVMVGNQRVAYARAWVYSQQKTQARLDFGSDDGIKVWLNGAVVHNNNTFRGISPNSDQVKVTLNAGWNSLLLKITQLNAGWAFCARVMTPDGQHLDGLKFTADPKVARQAPNKQPPGRRKAGL